MLIKFETKRDCGVTGLSFHGKRSWILASLYNGVIELWDYRNGVLIDSFHGDHNAPVRSVHFHSSEPLFVSGGDDCEIKVWSYKLRGCLFSLLGHRHHIRTVQFHHNDPWILSASDDHTIRIWNWNSRTCICVLIGHSHHVTCASFHPKKDLVVSASMDQTIRVWDIGSLRKKSQSFCDFDISEKHVLEGHDQVNWALFHPTLPLLYSGANDHQVKIWQMRGTYAWEMGTLRGHMHGVSCVLFHARQNVIVSNSQDQTIRVWDPMKRTCLETFCREERFRIIASHPSSNLVGAGHDNGMIVFKLARERPAFYVSGDSVLYVKNRVLHVFDYLTRTDVEMMSLSTPDSDRLNKGCRTLSYNPTENAVLICSDMELDYYELYTLPKESCCKGKSVQRAKRGIGGSSAFVARNRFAVLEKTSNQVLVKNLKNETVKKIALPIATDVIFQAGNGNLLCGAEDRVAIFDLQQQIVLGDIQTSFIKYVVWSGDMESVALLSKYSIIIADWKLVPQCKVHEKTCVKSGTWDDNGVFVYTTDRHIKYCLPNGDTGIIKTLGVPKYITKIYGSTIFCLDRDRKNSPVIIDSTEYIFKLSLLRKRDDQVMSMIKNSKLCGQSMIAYLQQKCFPEVALHFVKDERTRFNLALESGNIQIAVASAKKIDEKDYWNRLGAEALCQGNTGIVEYVYQRAKNFGRLSFLYLITGNLDKLSKVMKIAEVKNDVMSQFHHALYLGDIQERVKILENAGHLPLAYITASVHGLRDIAERLAVELADNVPSLPKQKSASLLMIPPKPILCGGDWSSFIATRGIFEGSLDNSSRDANLEYRDATDADFGETSVIGKVDKPKTLPNTRSSVFIAPTPGMPVSQIWVEDSSHAAEHAAAGNFETALFLLGERYGMINFSHFRSLFIDLRLGSQTYLCAFPSAPVISLAMDRYWNEYPNRDVHGNLALVFNRSEVRKRVKAARVLFLDEQFSDAFHLFQSALHVIPLSMVSSQKDTHNLLRLRRTIKNYLLVTKIQLKRRELKDNLVRQLELAAYSTHISLNTYDTRLVLFNVMTDCYKAGNRKTAAKFARRLLEANSTTDEQSKEADQVLQDPEENWIDVLKLNYDFAKPFKSTVKFVRRLLEANPTSDDQYSKAVDQVLQDAEENMRDLWHLNYDSARPFKICGVTLNPIYEGETAVICPYCKTDFVPSQKDQLCTVCDLAVVVDTANSICVYLFPCKYYLECAT